MRTLLRPALSLFILLSLVTGLAYPLLVTGLAQLFFPGEAAGSLVHEGRQGGRLEPDRPTVLGPEVFLVAPVGHLAAAVQRGGLERLEPGADQSGARRCREVAHRGAARGRSGQYASRCRSTSSPRRQAGSTRTSASPPRATRPHASRASASFRWNR